MATEAQQPTERPAKPGEYCTCGKAAITVFLGGPFGPTGYCGKPETRREFAAPCPWCGESKMTHASSRCPKYTIDAPPPHAQSHAG